MIALPASYGLYGAGYSLPPAVAYKYYRLTVNNTRDGGTSNQVFIPDFQILDAGGTNILTGGTASASSSQAGFGPSLAFDGNIGTGHRNVLGTFPYTISYELSTAATPYVLKGVFSNIGAWELAGSNDNISWTVLASETTAGWWNNEFNNPATYYYHPIAAAECWRLRIAAAQGGASQFQIYEWQLRDSGGAQLLSGGHAYASSTASYDPERFVDGNTATNFGQYIFSGNTIASGTVYIAYILPQGTTINPVDMLIAAHGTTSPPTDMYLDKSPDGAVTWINVGHFTTTWSGGFVSSQVFTL